MTTRITRDEAIEQAAKDLIKLHDDGAHILVRPFNQLKLALALPKETQFVLCDEFLELISMLQPKTKVLILEDLDNARRQAVAELAEGDLSQGAQELLQKHRKLADIAVVAFAKEQAEINSLNKKEESNEA